MDIVNQILDKKNRLSPGVARWEQVVRRLDRIRSILHLLDAMGPNSDIVKLIEDTSFGQHLEIGHIRYELQRYIPIGLVACMEGYFRLVYADLINSGSPYSDNAAKFDNLKGVEDFSIKFAMSLHTNSISLGEFVAHLLPTNSLKNIDDNVTKLIGEKFLTLFRKKRPETERYHLQELFSTGTDEEKAIEDKKLNDSTIKTVEQVFVLRHRYVHEIDPPIHRYDFETDPPTQIQDDEYIIWSSVESVVRFLWTTEHIVRELLSPQEAS